MQTLLLIRRFQQRIISHIERHITHRTVLDAGCGSGLNGYIFQQDYKAKVTLSDVVDNRHPLAQHMPFILSSVEKIPVTQVFDVVFLQYVLHHMDVSIKLDDVFNRLKLVSRKIIVVEDIVTHKTDIRKALEYDKQTNAKINQGDLYIGRYYSDADLKNYFEQTGLRLITEAVFQKGSFEDGFLDRKLYILTF